MKQLSHEIRVARPFSEALLLFTPKGEETWVPGWRPRYFEPPSGETCEEMLFCTDADGETAYWTCLAFQQERGHARYLRITPSSRAAFVDVQCHSDGPYRTRVQVTYEFVPFSDTGRAHIDAIDERSFAAMIDGWAALIESQADVLQKG